MSASEEQTPKKGWLNTGKKYKLMFYKNRNTKGISKKMRRRMRKKISRVSTLNS